MSYFVMFCFVSFILLFVLLFFILLILEKKKKTHPVDLKYNEVSLTMIIKLRHLLLLLLLQISMPHLE